MSLFRRPVERRAAGLSALLTAQGIPVRGGRSSMTATAGDAAALVAAGSAVRLFSNLISTMPVDTLRNGEPKVPPTWFGDPEGAGFGREDWLAQVVADAVGWGNVVCRIKSRDGGLKPTNLTPIQMSTVSAHVVDGHWWYRLGPELVPAQDVWHLRLYPRVGERFGLSPIAQHAETLGLASHGTRFLGQFYADGAHPSAILSVEADALTEAQAQGIKARFMAAMSGNREPAVLNKALKYEAISVSPVDADLLNSMKWSATETARIFGPGVAEVLGYESGGSMTYSNIESRALHLLTFAIDPVIVRLEKALTATLPGPTEVKFNRGSLLRTDLKTRYESYALAVTGGWLTVNEARALEDRPALPGGDSPRPPTAPSVAVGGTK